MHSMKSENYGVVVPTPISTSPVISHLPASSIQPSLGLVPRELDVQRLTKMRLYGSVFPPFCACAIWADRYKFGPFEPELPELVVQ